MLLRIIYSLLLFISVSSFSLAQTSIDWETLSDVKFEVKYDEKVGISYEEATFGPGVIPLDGQQVALTGYMIPLDGFGVAYALSRNPNSSCFFCGGAGPETVVELKLKPTAMRRYRTDDRLLFKGTLQLSRSNADNFTYVLLNAEPVN